MNQLIATARAERCRRKLGRHHGAIAFASDAIAADECDGDQGLVSADADADQRISRIAITRSVDVELAMRAALHMHHALQARGKA